MTPVNPTLIPHICNEIIRHLSLHDMIQATLVCKTWREAILTGYLTPIKGQLLTLGVLEESGTIGDVLIGWRSLLGIRTCKVKEMLAPYARDFRDQKHLNKKGILTAWKANVLRKRSARALHIRIYDRSTVTHRLYSIARAAILAGDLKCLGRCFRDGIRANASDDYNVSMLHLAVEGGSLPVVQLLLTYNVDVNELCLNSTKSKLTSVKGINGAPLHWAAAMGHLSIVQKLVEAGAQVNNFTQNCITPLMLAAEKGHDSVVRWLCERGADVKIRCMDRQHQGLRAYQIAIKLGHASTAEIIRQQRG